MTVPARHPARAPARRPARGPARYGRFARLYDALAFAWSGGAIGRARRAAVDGVGPGQRVLVVGAGTGDAAVTAARSGAEVVAFDVSDAMLDRVRGRAEATGVHVATRVGDVRAPGAIEPAAWDRIAAPFLLTCIAADELDAVVRTLAAGLAPGGTLAVSDFVPAPRGGLTRGLYRLYYGGPSLLFGALARNPVQPPHDLTDPAAAAGLVVERRARVGVYGIGPRWYETVVWRQGDPPVD